MTLTDLLVASTPMIVLLLWLAWRGIAMFIAWRRERKYQAEWHRTFGSGASGGSAQASRTTGAATPSRSAP